jgi:BirA family transcriptional regulator, biotin operon repressor / biotin---[acetyl-CoA-carboxylase] ligase
VTDLAPYAGRVDRPDRPALDREVLLRAVAPPWTSLEVVESTESTNADLAGAAPGTVLVAEHQLAGRGRLERSWVTPARAALTFSVAVQPTSPVAGWGWLALLAGVALRDAVAPHAGATLKWPNDLLVGGAGRKAAGILVQAADHLAVIGIGLNVSTRRDELPVATATSLALEGVVIDRSELLVAILDSLGSRLRQWQAANGDADASGLAEAYGSACSTIGLDVLVTGTDGVALSGRAVGIDSSGRLRLVVRGTDQRGSDQRGTDRRGTDRRGTEKLVAAGDVEHIRPA